MIQLKINGLKSNVYTILRERSIHTVSKPKDRLLITYKLQREKGYFTIKIFGLFHLAQVYIEPLLNNLAHVPKLVQKEDYRGWHLCGILTKSVSPISTHKRTVR